jgi:hypothetical protein
MVVGVGFCKIKVDSNFLLVLKIKCTKFHQDRSKTVDLHTKYTNKQTFSFIKYRYVITLLESFRALDQCKYLGFLLLYSIWKVSVEHPAFRVLAQKYYVLKTAYNCYCLNFV